LVINRTDALDENPRSCPATDQGASVRTLIDNVIQWRKRGDAARALANQLSTPVARSVVLLVAEACDRLDEQISARIARRAGNSTIAEG
jgi:hypothetical protein